MGFVVVIKVLHAIVAQCICQNRRVTAFAVPQTRVFVCGPKSSYFNRGVVEGILTKHNARLSGYIFVFQ